MLDNVDFLPDLLDIPANAFSRGLPENGADKLAALEKIIALRDLPQLIDIRNFGLLGAVTLAPDARFPGSAGVPVHNRCWENGLLCRAVGDNLVMSPPLVIAEREIDLFIERLRQSIRDVFG